MKFSVGSKIFDKWLGVKIGVLVITNMNNSGHNEEILKLLRGEEEKQKAILSGKEFNLFPEIMVWRKTYKEFGSNYHDFRSSAEALLRRVRLGNLLPQINNLVDLYNYLSIKYHVPVGAEDLDKVKGDISLTFAIGLEKGKYIGSEKEEVCDMGEVIYKDEAGFICRKWNWREGDRTKIGEETKNAVLVLEAMPPVTEEQLNEASDEAVDLIKKYLGGRVEKTILSKENSSIENSFKTGTKAKIEDYPSSEAESRVRSLKTNNTSSHSVRTINEKNEKPVAKQQWQKGTIGNEIIKLLYEVAKEFALEGDINFDDIKIEHPADEIHGDFSSNFALQAFKKVKANIPGTYLHTIAVKSHDPYQFATAIAEIITNKKVNFLEKVEAAGPGFINFFLAPKYLLEQAGEIFDTGGEYGQNETMKGKKFMVEFAHPNTHKMFHIGHLRNATTGECLVRISEANGAKIIRANYEGDVGMHIAKCLYSIMQKSKNSSVILGNPAKQGDSGIKRDSDSGQARMTINDLENQYKTIKERVEFLGKMYAEGNKAYEEDEKAKKEILEINKKIYAKDPEVYDLWKVTRQWSLSYFETIYKRIYTHFDRYYFESECYEHGKELVMEGLKRSVFEESEGAIIFPGEKFGTHTRVFITKEGNTTYEGKDMALGELQFKEYTPDLIIHVVGPEQADYFKVIFEALGQLFSGMKEKEKHVPYGWVKLKKGKMSSREGNVVLGEWLLDEAKERVKKIMGNVVVMKNNKEIASSSFDKLRTPRNDNDIVEGIDVSDVAEKVAVGAVKYSFLKVSLASEIAFDIDESINFEGDSGPYLQYTYARTQSVLRKVQSAKFKVQSQSGNLQIFKSLNLANEELSLLRWLYRFPEVVLEAGENYSPNVICGFLFELAQRYNLFYNKLPILKAESDERRNFRLMLNEAVGIVLKNGLNLLGIEAVERM